MANRLDLVVFGATGFTGQYTVEEVIHIAEEHGISWGVSGRNKEKLEALLKRTENKLGKDLSKIEIIVANVDDAESLEEMALRAKVVLNCCGPYIHWGEQVVKACIASGAHHLDISGEPEFMEKIQTEYHDAALQKGVYVVSACGFASIPADLGLFYLQQHFKGDLNSVESYLQLTIEGGRRRGALVHFGTYESGLYGAPEWMRTPSGKLFPTRPITSPPLKPRKLFKNDVINKWCVPFLGPDQSVMLRSQRYFQESDNKRPVQVETYIGFSSWFAALGIMLGGAMASVLARLSCGRSLLLKYPRFFTAGMVSHVGPSEETMENTKFSFTLVGEGWEELTDIHEGPPKKRMAVQVNGRNPAYGAACVTFVTSALMILKEADKMPERGGVYAPGAAFAKTSLIREVHKRGLTFEVVPEKSKL